LTILFLAVLVMAWFALIIPAAWRARQTAPYSAAQGFKKRLDLIAPRTPRANAEGRWIVVPQSRDRLERAAYRRGQRRRRRILFALGAGVVVSAVTAAFVGGAVWELQVFLDISLGLYVALLLMAKRRRAELVRDFRSIEKRRQTSEEPRFFEPLGAGGRGG
jgi:Flp pilus assembly protein TadB